jgi:hypothetical protein
VGYPWAGKENENPTQTHAWRGLAPAPMLRKRSQFGLPKIHAHLIGESRNSENKVLGDISLTQEFTLLGVGFYEETAMTIPYRYSVPILILYMVLYWMISQALYYLSFITYTAKIQYNPVGQYMSMCLDTLQPSLFLLFWSGLQCYSYWAYWH